MQKAQIKRKLSHISLMTPGISEHLKVQNLVVDKSYFKSGMFSKFVSKKSFMRIIILLLSIYNCIFIPI